MSDELKPRGPKTTQNSALKTQHSAKTGTVLAFDFGEKRIGVAVGDTETGLAHPLTTITASDNRSRFAAIGALIEEWRPACLVVGLPAHADDTEHATSRLCRRFAQRLEGRFGIHTRLVDERLTSRAAETALRDAGARGARLKAALDQAAAREILATYLASIQNKNGS
ncbi:MAG: Holliday junction resolvase RuvX [Burkholderiales bacterium]|nr:Holliday junction resolvase RuvX [Burkholderiales bacterium]